MNLPTLPPRYDTRSHLRCPRTRCDAYGKRLELEVGQHETFGELNVRHFCVSCGFSERGPVNATVAAKSPTLAAIRDRIRADRLTSWVIPMRTDLPAVEEVEADA